MRALRLALSLILIPRLFGSLLLWPLCIGIFIALTQITFSAAYLDAKNTSVRKYQEKAENIQRGSYIRSFLYQSAETLPPIFLCRQDELQKNCIVDEKDIVVQTQDVATFNVEQYLDFFNGTARQLVVCRDCSSSLTIQANKESNTTFIRTLTGLLLLFHAENFAERKLNTFYAGAKQHIESVKDLQGIIFFTPSVGGTNINLSTVSSLILLIVNTSFLVVITLWLALRAHRKVLDYFAKNDCLLPMVAACGKNNFYIALWLLTILRVMFFLSATVPVGIFFFIQTVPEEIKREFIGNYFIFCAWLLAISTSLGVTVVIASVAELKQRVVLLSILYRYTPLLLCVIGGALWAITLFDALPNHDLINNIVASLPILGLTAVILQPIVSLSLTTLFVHAILSTALMLFILRKNALWFAAHLEEI